MPMNEVDCRVRLRGPLQRLELYAGKLARTVLRGGCDGNVASLPDKRYTVWSGLRELGHHGRQAAGE